jgi:hypothetical protein
MVTTLDSRVSHIFVCFFIPSGSQIFFNTYFEFHPAISFRLLLNLTLTLTGSPFDNLITPPGGDANSSLA